MKKVVPFAVFLIFLGLWTWKLLEPNPVPELIERQIPVNFEFVLAKSLHAGAYAFLTILAAFLPIRRPYFWAVVAILALHGVGTEIGQTFVPNRNGCVRDVIIDWGRNRDWFAGSVGVQLLQPGHLTFHHIVRLK